MSVIDEANRRRSALEDRHRPWRSMTLAGLLDVVAAQYPDRPFVIGEDGAFSYGELAERSACLARGLISRGVRAGERVALVMPNGADMIAARFAIARAGAVAVPISVRLRALELAQVLQQSQANALITMEEFPAPSNAGTTPPAPQAGLDGISCTSARKCVAVGSYEDSSGNGQAMEATEANGTWGRATEVAAPSNAAANPDASLGGISCTSARKCVAVGSYWTAPATARRWRRPRRGAHGDRRSK